MKGIALFLCITMALAMASAVQGRTKLTTLPQRDSLVVNLEHPDYSLLVEEREVTLQAGPNFIDFSWQGVSIDPNSIQLDILEHPGDGPDATKIVSVSYPPNEAALTWRVFSPEPRTERLRVSYLLRGVSRITDYDLTVNGAETAGLYREYVRLTNASGEDFSGAAILVRPGQRWEGEIDAGEVRRFLATSNPSLPVSKLYAAAPSPGSTGNPDGEAVALLYEITNDGASGLGTYKLDIGKARIFGESPSGGSIFIGEDILAETPVAESVELALGTVKDIVLKRNIMDDRRENIRRNRSNRVVLYDRIVHVRFEIENFKDEAAAIRITESLPVDAQIVELEEPGVRAERKGNGELVVTVDLEPRPADAAQGVPVREVNMVYRVPNVVN